MLGEYGADGKLQLCLYKMSEEEIVSDTDIQVVVVVVVVDYFSLTSWESMGLTENCNFICVKFQKRKLFLIQISTKLTDGG